MYESIRGELTAKDPGAAIIEAGGIGYRVHITSKTYDDLPAMGEEVRLFLHHTINAEQGVERLYAFADQSERVIFRQLLDVQRIGPSVALRVLSNAGIENLISAIAGGDVLFLKKVKGVGPKMAERLVVELQEPLSKLGLLSMAGGADTKAAAPSGVAHDAVAALVSLGYKPSASEKAVSKAVKSLGNEAETSEVIRAALQEV